VVLTTRVPDGPNPPWRAHFYQGELIRRQSHNGDYVCPCGGVVMSSSDRTDSNAQVPAVRHAWVSVAMSRHARH
jgi:hypothetical protein